MMNLGFGLNELNDADCAIYQIVAITEIVGNGNNTMSFLTSHQIARQRKGVLGAVAYVNGATNDIESLPVGANAVKIAATNAVLWSLHAEFECVFGHNGTQVKDYQTLVSASRTNVANSFKVSAFVDVSHDARDPFHTIGARQTFPSIATQW